MLWSPNWNNAIVWNGKVSVVLIIACDRYYLQDNLKQYQVKRNKIVIYSLVGVIAIAKMLHQ